MPQDGFSQYFPSYSDYQSPQRRAVTGIPQYVPYEQIIRERAKALPDMYEASRMRELQDEQIAAQKQAFEDARTQARWGTAIEAGNLGVTSGAFEKIYNTAKPLWTSSATPIQNDLVPSTLNGNQFASNAASGVVSDTGTVSWMPESTKAIPSVGQSSGIAAWANKPIAGLSKIPGIGKGFTTGVGLAGSLGGEIATRTNMPDWLSSSKAGALHMGKKEAKVTSGALGGAMAGFVASGFNPLGALAGAVFGGLGGLF